MGIALSIEKYCGNCPDFEPDVEKNECRSFDFSFGGDRVIAETVVMCKYRHRCASQMEYLKEQNRKEKRDG